MPTTVSINYRDAAGTEKRETMRFRSGLTVANINNWLTVALPLINDTISAQITDVKVGYSFDYSLLGLRAAPVTGSRLSTGVRLGFRDSGGAAESIFLPAINNLWVAGGEVNLGAGGDAPYDFVTLCVDPGYDDGGTAVMLASRSDLNFEDFRGGKLTDRDYI